MLFPAVTGLAAAGKSGGGRTGESLIIERLGRWWQGQWLSLLEEASPEALAARAVRPQETVAAAATDAAAAESSLQARRAGLCSEASPPLCASTRIDAEAADGLRTVVSDGGPGPPPAELSEGDRTAETTMRAAVREQLVKGLLRGTRRRAPGPLGTRWEHQGLMRAQIVGIDALADALVELTCMAESARASRQRIAAATGPRQFGVGRSAGKAHLFRALELDIVSCTPVIVIVHLDMSNAFGGVLRAALGAASADACTRPCRRATPRRVHSTGSLTATGRRMCPRLQPGARLVRDCNEQHLGPHSHAGLTTCGRAADASENVVTTEAVAQRGPGAFEVYNSALEALHGKRSAAGPRDAVRSLSAEEGGPSDHRGGARGPEVCRFGQRSGLAPRNAAFLRAAGGPGSSGRLACPSKAEHAMADRVFVAAAEIRLRWRATCCRRVLVGHRGWMERCAGGRTAAQSTPFLVLAEGERRSATTR